MRWFWIDRFTHFERGRRAVAIKGIAMCEEQLDGYTKASDQIIKGRAKGPTWVSIHRDCGFQQVRRGHADHR